MAPRISVGVASEGRLNAFLRLTETYYQGKSINESSVVHWRHMESPRGPSATVELMDGEDSVGRMWIRTHSWSIHGQPLVAANPIDFLIREDHRRLPAFMALFNATMTESQRLGDLVYHTSNPQTDDLYSKLMKLKPVAELDGAVVPVHPFRAAAIGGILRLGLAGRALDSLFSAFLRGLAQVSRLTGVRLSEAPPPEVQDHLISAFLAEESVCNMRTGDHRAWRFQGAGSVHYDQRWIFRGRRALGYVVTTDRDVESLKARWVVDIVMPGRPSRAVIWAMWLQQAARAARAGRDALFFLSNQRNTSLAHLASLPMVRIPRPRLPQRVPVFVRASKGGDPSRLQGVDLAGGYYVLSDFDMF